MKHLLTACLFFSFFSIANAQSDTTKVEQYCQLVATARFMSTKVTIDIDFGEARKFFGNDTRMKDAEGNIKKFNGVVDALNYMGRIGWTMVNAYPITSGNQLVYHYIFKKQFNRTELDQ